MKTKAAASRGFLKVSCLGFYVRVAEYDEVKDKVFHYIEVMARPMVMYQNDHPVQWTPAYVGGKVLSRVFVMYERLQLCFCRLIRLLKTEAAN